MSTITSLYQITHESEEYKEAKFIDIANQSLYYLPKISGFNYLTKLYCCDNSLIEIPVLPPNLKLLNCSHNKLNYLPNVLPSTLEILSCGYNYLRSLPELPISLRILLCNCNEIYKIPKLPDSLHSLLCSSNEISHLPELPNSLRFLSVDYNELMYLPHLPDSLITLNFASNYILELPKRLPLNLCGLYMSNNNISELPTELPHTLTTLSCEVNNLSILPMLPIRLALICYDNPLDRFYPTLINTSNKEINVECVNIMNKFRNSYYYNKYKWRFLEFYAKVSMHPNKINEKLKNMDINDVIKHNKIK